MECEICHVSGGGLSETECIVSFTNGGANNGCVVVVITAAAYSKKLR